MRHLDATPSPLVKLPQPVLDHRGRDHHQDGLSVQIIRRSATDHCGDIGDPKCNAKMRIDDAPMQRVKRSSRSPKATRILAVPTLPSPLPFDEDAALPLLALSHSHERTRPSDCRDHTALSQSQTHPSQRQINSWRRAIYTIRKKTCYTRLRVQDRSA